MRRFTFLSAEYFYTGIGLWVWIILNLSLGYKIVATVIVGVLTYFYRRASVPYRETIRSDGEIYLSPVHGEVQSIRQNINVSEDPSYGHEVRISISTWDEKGLYLPTSGEVTYLKANRGIKIPRDSDAQSFYRPVEELEHTDFVLTSEKKSNSLMRFIDCKTGKRPDIWLKYGDRGRGAACFGYYPFGGTLLIYLPRNSDILVFEKERIVPGQTVIASIKDIK